MVRYSDLIREGVGGLTANRFVKYRQLAIFEHFSELTVKEKAERLEVSHWAIREWKKDPDYERVLDRLVVVAEDAARDRSVVEAAQAYEPVLVGELLNTALYGSGRDKLKAIDEFTGRISAKKGREGGEIHLRLPDEFIEQIKEAQKIQQKQLPPAELVDDVIEASVVSVPEYEDDE